MDTDTQTLSEGVKHIIRLNKETLLKLLPETATIDCDDIAAFSIKANLLSLNADDIVLLDKLTNDISIIVNELKTNISTVHFNYLLDYLHEFKFVDSKFLDSLTVDDLYPFLYGLSGFLSSLTVYGSASNGNLDIVKNFLSKHPVYKDKPGLKGETLLYLAVISRHMQLVDYLIRTIKCSVDAQNGLNQSSAGDTALHGACIYAHFDMIKYLIKHSANCYIKNQANKTPFMELDSKNEDVVNWIKNNFIISYIDKNSDQLPVCTLEELEPKKDCVWEYKRHDSENWNQLQNFDSINAALSTPDKDFDTTVYLPSDSGTLYNISLVKFLRSRNNSDRLAWIRCRGSSFYNFDIDPMWQFMLLKHTNNNQQSSSLLSTDKIYELNTWYDWNARSCETIDKIMNNRFRRVAIELSTIGNVELDLRKFTFENSNKTTYGHLRWLPNYLSIESDSTTDKMNLHQRCVPKRRKDDVLEKLASNLTEIDDEDNIASEDKQQSNSNQQQDIIMPLSDNDRKMHTTVERIPPIVINDHRSVHNQTARQLIVSSIQTKEGERNRIKANIKIYRKELEKAEQELKNIKTEKELKESKRNLIEKLIGKTRAAQEEENEQLRQEKQQEQKIKELESENERLNVKLNDKQNSINEWKEKHKQLDEREKELNDILNAIITVDYEFPAKEYLLTTAGTFRESLKSIQCHYDEYIFDLPSVTVLESVRDERFCTFRVKGFHEHHNEMAVIQKNIYELINTIHSEQSDHWISIKDHVRSTVRELQSVNCRWDMKSDWIRYSTQLMNSILAKQEQLTETFNKTLDETCITLVKVCIKNTDKQWRQQLYSAVARNAQIHSFKNAVKNAKHLALEDYINKIEVNNIATGKSIHVRDQHLRNLVATFKEEQESRASDANQYNNIPAFLQRINIYFRCFALQLPLFESSIELLEKIEQKTVVTISTPTGSGKSTLLPALLLASGYDKIIVTQPRRFPCTQISERVNSTIGEISGWCVSGAQSNSRSPILYLTDGLLKDYLQFNQNFITQQVKFDRRFVIMLDEVHERSVNIDLCIALIIRLLTTQPYLNHRLKIIISSATLDNAICKKFESIEQCSVYQFSITMPPLYDVVLHHTTKSILELVLDLYKKCEKSYEQILCFVKSVQEVFELIKLLSELSNGTITAYPLIQSQSAVYQKNIIEHKKVFFSTTVAETSLTFPHLRYVVDSGVLHLPVYDPEKNRTILKEVFASESTIKQRRGRLGRTQPGDYYALYDVAESNRTHPIPQICQMDLVNIEFSLRKAPLKMSLNDLKYCLPDPPEQSILTMAIKQLQQLDILDDTNDHFTPYGLAISKLPDFGSLSMSIAVFSALTDYNCGQDLIRLASILGVLNTSNILKQLPARYKSADGDFMTVLNVMNDVLAIKHNLSSREFNKCIYNICDQKGLSSVKHILKQAIRRLSSLEQSFNICDKYRFAAHISCGGKWECIARALLQGYTDNTFVSMKDLQGKTHNFVRYNHLFDNAVLDFSSTLNRPMSETPVSIILARDVRYSTAVRQIALLSFVGEVKSTWLENRICRAFNGNEEEKQQFLGIYPLLSKDVVHVEILVDNNKLKLSGKVGDVLDLELLLKRQLLTTRKFTILNGLNIHENYKRNVESLACIPHIFNPLKWRWKAQEQVDIVINTLNTSIEVIQ
ncbi:unnamed protein product, partial [Didymodactylos carnosus]